MPLSRPIAASSPAFSRAFGSFAVFTLSFHWLSKVFGIGRCDYFGFGSMTLNRKALLYLALFCIE